MYLTLDI
jgi:hypothetical protein